jgi:hypothetical protein
VPPSDPLDIQLADLLDPVALNARLQDQGTRIRAYTNDPTCTSEIVEIPNWAELHPDILIAEQRSPPRYTIAPAAIPEGTTLLVAGQQFGLTTQGDPLIAAGLYLVKDPPPPCVPQKLRLARPPSQLS